jgi:OmpA-OmpF porin, OOP family
MLKLSVTVFMVIIFAATSHAGWFDDAVQGAAERLGNRAVEEAADGTYEGAKEGLRKGTGPSDEDESEKPAPKKKAKQKRLQVDENDGKPAPAQVKSNKTVDKTNTLESGDGLKDTQYFSAMPSYYVGEATDREFDAHDFFDGKKTLAVEGKYWKKQYWLKENARQSSEIQIIRNYAAAVKSMGGKVLIAGVCSDCEARGCSGNIMTGKVTKGASELWVQVIPCNDGTDYTLVVVEKETMKQDVTANDMLEALNKQGFVALYINFDTNKASVKPESRPIVDQIMQLLKENPALKVGIEGHTDSTGAPAKNKTLSKQRAESVLDALVKQGIDSKRLSATGWGQEKPMADNKTDEGKAKNRRVEIVKK